MSGWGRTCVPGLRGREGGALLVGLGARQSAGLLRVSGSPEALHGPQWGGQHTGALPTGTASTAHSCYSPGEGGKPMFGGAGGGGGDRLPSSRGLPVPMSFFWLKRVRERKVGTRNWATSGKGAADRCNSSLPLLARGDHFTV